MDTGLLWFPRFLRNTDVKGRGLERSTLVFVFSLVYLFHPEKKEEPDESELRIIYDLPTITRITRNFSIPGRCPGPFSSCPPDGKLLIFSFRFHLIACKWSIRPSVHPSMAFEEIVLEYGAISHLTIVNFAIPHVRWTHGQIARLGNPKPETRNPKLETRNSKLETRNP